MTDFRYIQSSHRCIPRVNCQMNSMRCNHSRILSITSNAWRVSRIVLCLVTTCFVGCDLVFQRPPSPPTDPLDRNFAQTQSTKPYDVFSQYQPPVEMVVENTDEMDLPVLNLHGRVLDDTGQPSANAIVGCWCGTWDTSVKFVGKTTTNALGQYNIDASVLRWIEQEFEMADDTAVREHQRKMGAVLPANRRHYKDGPGLRVTLAAVAPNQSIGATKPQVLWNRSSIQCDIQMRNRSGIVGGQVVDENHDPVPGQTVRLSQLRDVDEGILGIDSSISIYPKWTATTDSDGRFVFCDLPGNMQANVSVSTENILHDQNRARANTSPLATPDQNSNEAANPCVLIQSQKRRPALVGLVTHTDGQAAPGVLVRTLSVETETDRQGRYELSLASLPRQLDFELPGQERFGRQSMPVDRKAWFKGQPQPTVKLVPMSRIQGQVVSAFNDQPLAGMNIISGKSRSAEIIATTGAQGRFDGWTRADTTDLHVEPAWLSQSERMLSRWKGIPDHAKLVPVPANNSGLMETEIPVNTPGLAKRLQVELPDRSPLSNAKVELWTQLKLKSGNVVHQSRLHLGEPGEEKPVAAKHWATTDVDGRCTLTPTMIYDSDLYAVVQHPVVDPKYVGELNLGKLQDAKHPGPIVKLRLRPLQWIQGDVTLNAKPIQGIRIRAQVNNGKTASAPPVRYRILSFEGVSDPGGQYSISIPAAPSIGIDFGYGFTRQANLVANMPVMMEDAMGSMVGDDAIVEGPSLKLFAGKKTIRGTILGRNGKPFGGSTLTLDLPPGHGVINFRYRSLSDVHPDGSYNPQGPGNAFELSGLPEGEWGIYAFSRPFFPPGRKRPEVLVLKRESPTVKVSAGQTGVVIKLTRQSR